MNMLAQQRPLVSVVCITYNHASFIRDCLDSFVMQKTSFPFEVLVHDDASTDKTPDIVREYAERYPEIIIPFYEAENKFGKTDFYKELIFPSVRGKYFALCEGDDYWTDPYKLQKQVDMLESRTDASICFHNVEVHWNDGHKKDSVFPDPSRRFYKEELSLDDLLKQNFIQTNSVMYRWRFHEDSLDLIPDKILPGDWFLHLLHAQKGKILFLEDIMGVYRRHAGGIWFQAEKSVAWFKNCGLAHVHFYEAMERQFKVDRQYEKHKLIIQCYFCAHLTDDNEWLSSLRCEYPIDEKELKVSFWELLLLKMASLFTFGQTKKKLQQRKKIVRSCLALAKDFLR